MARQKQFSLSFPDEEKKLIAEAAEVESVSMGSLIRRSAVWEAKRILKTNNDLEVPTQ